MYNLPKRGGTRQCVAFLKASPSSLAGVVVVKTSWMDSLRGITLSLKGVKRAYFGVTFFFLLLRQYRIMRCVASRASQPWRLIVRKGVCAV